ncbi:hypothetical protein PENARI_c014G00266 [Penicillium arizonense]|uniref:Uncharacterized protein n=1 Tax=Penicillium arizonense TaxID=1835702 RepID=A0A1F5LDE0_PENAI|nr:hypothetical protein PENARI_c014G00266 [Penicillium arizonense]OGE51175.1 hypothetical protein PENARI_c014G00266 [Penicillium arizonense]
MTAFAARNGCLSTQDTKYGWVDIVQLAKDDNAQTDATLSKPVKNADTFSYWINDVILNFATSAAGGVKMSIKQHRQPKNRDHPDSLSALKHVVFKPEDHSSW